MRKLFIILVHEKKLIKEENKKIDIFYVFLVICCSKNLTKVTLLKQIGLITKFLYKLSSRGSKVETRPCCRVP
jgi:hypothetical protein